MLNVNGIKRNAKNIVKKYSDAQVKVREATSNDPWGPSATIMAEIADLTYNVVAFSEIMQMIWKRLNDHGKNWRHVYKALVLLEYVIKTGSDKVAQQCTENIFAIQTLKDFQFMEENKDHGMNIREKSKKLVALLKDSEKLKAERSRALKAKARLAESMSSVGKSSLGLMMGPSGTKSDGPVSSTTNGSDSYQNNDSGSSSAYLQDASASMVSPELDSARPQSLTEEEQQLRLALALSKEEAEQQEKTRKNDELRLKLALDVSKRSAAPSSSNLIDDFDVPSTSTGAQAVSASASTGAATSSAIAAPAAAAAAAAGPSSKPLITSTTVSAPAAQSKSAIDDLLGLSIPAPNEAQAATTSLSSLTASQGSTTHPPTLPMNSVNFATSTLPSSVFPEPSNDPWSVDPWKATSNTNSSSFPASSFASASAQQAPINMLPLLTSVSTMPQITPAGFGGPSNGSGTSGGFFDAAATTTAANRRPMSKNPFQD